MRIFAQSPQLIRANRSSGDTISLAGTGTTWEDSVEGVPAGTTFGVHTDGLWYATGDNFGNLGSGTWCTPTANAGNYSVRWTITNGTLTSGTSGTWLAVTSNRTWYVQRSLTGSKQCIGTVEIAATSNTAVILATSSVTILATVTAGGVPGP